MTMLPYPAGRASGNRVFGSGAAALLLMLTPLASAVPSASTAAVPAPIADASHMIDAGKVALKHGWRYHELDSDSKGTKFMSYDPTRPQGQRWQLLAINGKRPSAAAKKQWMARQAKEGGLNAMPKPAPKKAGHKKGGSTMSFGTKLLGNANYKRLPSQGDRLVYQLCPRTSSSQSKMQRALLKHIVIRLVLARSDHHPLSMKMYATKSFSPHFAVTINKFRIQMTFTRIAKGGPVVATTVHSLAKITAFWVKHINQNKTEQLSDFVPVGGTASTPAPATR